ncbi:MAG: hypothetical protein K0B52_05840 [FCB group bacterium]|nr:hypothetical protein [FCB group bacterium]
MKHPNGCHTIAGRTYFTLYAPYASHVRLLLFERCEDKNPREFLLMRSIGDGYWEYSDVRSFDNVYYAFSIDNKKELIADPYARSVSTRNDHLQEAKAFIFKDDFQWEDADFRIPEDPRNLIIYECHLCDMTMHPRTANPFPGSYKGMEEQIGYLRDLGVNAVEFLPLMQFANHEPPYREKIGDVFNYWNPYAYNYWGYMTSFFFAPANFYASGVHKEKNAWCDPRGAEILELKSLVNTLHKAGIAVIMDVVFNHISQYNLNPLRYLAKDRYLRVHENHSGCGNDTRSESAVMRELIIESIRYWIKEFHIDGFRFDLTGILDDETLTAVREAAEQENPHIIMVGEPWGRRYFPHEMSQMGWGIWNDMYRNGIKGSDPMQDKGFLFGNDGKNPGVCFTGSLQKDGGLVTNSRFTVNYLESHDGYTLGDFIRIATRPAGELVHPEHARHISLTKTEARLHRLAAFILACSQGIMMIHAGQEYARSKVIVPAEGIEDPQTGELDADSYAKDNETNYLNFDDIDINRDLYDHYKKMICIRKSMPELCSAARDNIRVLEMKGSPAAAGYVVETPERRTVVLVNTSEKDTAQCDLGESGWRVLLDPESVSGEGSAVQSSSIIDLNPCSYRLLIKEKKG